MNKIVNFNDLKNKNSDNKNKYLYDVKHNDVLNLIADKKYKEALLYAEQNYNEYGLVEQICESLASAISINFDTFNETEFEKYYNILNKIYSNFKNNDLICFFVIASYLSNIDKLKQIEGETFDYSKIFDEIYSNHTQNLNIVLTYSSYLLHHTDLFDINQDENINIFQAVVNRYLLLIVDFDDNIQIATDFAKFCYLSCAKTNNKYIIDTSYELLCELKDDFSEHDELVSYYCLFIANNFIKDTSINSLKYINQFKSIMLKSNNFIFKEMYFVSLYNALTEQSYEDSKFILNEMSLLLYNLPINEKMQYVHLIELYAECLSNFSCENNISVNLICNELLPAITKLINVFDNIDSIIDEYCVILYNISCLIKFYEGEDAPHIDIVEELENCANNVDSSIPYYCMCLSNLIHLNDSTFALNTTKKIENFVNCFTSENMPSAKNDIKLTSIYAMALANAVDVCNTLDAKKLILTIKGLLGDSSDFNFDILDTNLKTLDFKILYHYTRALTYYIAKLTNINEINECQVYLLKFNELLNEQEN